MSRNSPPPQKGTKSPIFIFLSLGYSRAGGRPLDGSKKLFITCDINTYKVTKIHKNIPFKHNMHIWRLTPLTFTYLCDLACVKNACKRIIIIIIIIIIPAMTEHIFLFHCLSQAIRCISAVIHFHRKNQHQRSIRLAS